MDCVFAKIKGNKKKSIFKLISGSGLYEPVVIRPDSLIPYNPDHNLDEDSWFQVENFSAKDFCLSLLKQPFDSKDFDELEKSQFESISYVFAVQDGDFYFQKITNSCVIRRKIISFGEFAEIETPKCRIFINAYPDAIYLSESDRLIFRNLSGISSIFKGIDVLFREATEVEVAEFLASPFISLAPEYSEPSVSKPNRKRIGLVMDSLSKMSGDEKANMHKYINEYSSDRLEYDESKSQYKISNDDELKYLLYGIEQRFYTTPFSKEKRLANSVVSL